MNSTTNVPTVPSPRFRVNLLTYPARPVNGGPLDKAPPKCDGPDPEKGRWFYEPKYNGWRAMVHVPTGTMFNRHNEPLTIQSEFTRALNHLREFSYEWLDCEALERRHDVGRGALIILDSPDLAPMPYWRRREILERHFQMLAMDRVPEDGSVYLPLSYPLSGLEPGFWDLLKKDNAAIKRARRLTEDFYEGCVAKRGDTRYPIQLRNAKEEFGGWMKHRWQF